MGELLGDDYSMTDVDECSQQQTPLVSIIVTSYAMSRFRDLCDLLHSVKLQTYADVETLVVVERDLELFQSLATYVFVAKVPGVRLILTDERGASACRNVGIRQARGNLVAFADDDVVLFVDWAEELVKTYSDRSIVGLTGPAFPLCREGSIRWLPAEFHWMVSCTTWYECDKIVDIRNVWTENASFRKDVLDLVGGFCRRIGPRGGSMEGRKRYISEDVELSMRVRRATRKRIVYNPRVRVWHKVYECRLTWGYVVQWSYWVGLSKQILRNTYSKDFGDQDLVEMENNLLRRIFTRLFPGMARAFFREPAVALHQLSVTVVALLFVAFGHCVGYFRTLRERPSL